MKQKVIYKSNSLVTLKWKNVCVQGLNTLSHHYARTVCS